LRGGGGSRLRSPRLRPPPPLKFALAATLDLLLLLTPCFSVSLSYFCLEGEKEMGIWGGGGVMGNMREEGGRRGAAVAACLA